MRLLGTPIWDRELCLRLNRANQWGWCSSGFGIVSRLGDGMVWYGLIMILPLVYGPDDLALSLRMMITGATCTVIYKAIKCGTQRPRPCEVFQVLRTVEPLDRFSFPSGHSLHAVAFTWMAVEAHPELGLVLVPFTALVALSRMVLGLHYPTDVLAGSAIGAGVAAASGVLAG